MAPCSVLSKNARLRNVRCQTAAGKKPVGTGKNPNERGLDRLIIRPVNSYNMARISTITVR